MLEFLKNAERRLRRARKQIRADIRKHQTLAGIASLKPLNKNQNSPAHVVSLTSHGKRLSDTAPCAIASLFKQTVPPDKIILWVGEEDGRNIGGNLRKLAEKGLEIRFCGDLKSYTKLIPAILEFPNDYIITADDDLYYPKNWLEQLLAEHGRNPKKIICHRVHGIKVDGNHKPLPYSQWDYCIESKRAKESPFAVFPTGVGGILYPPHCFYKDIADTDLFMKLTPKNDDIWFWAMAVMNKEYFGAESPYVVVENGYSRKLQDVDPRQQQDGNALSNYNWGSGNDGQLKAVIEHFPQLNEILGRMPG